MKAARATATEALGADAAKAAQRTATGRASVDVAKVAQRTATGRASVDVAKVARKTAIMKGSVNAAKARKTAIVKACAREEGAASHRAEKESVPAVKEAKLAAARVNANVVFRVSAVAKAEVLEDNGRPFGS